MFYLEIREFLMNYYRKHYNLYFFLALFQFNSNVKMCFTTRFYGTLNGNSVYIPPNSKSCGGVMENENFEKFQSTYRAFLIRIEKLRQILRFIAVDIQYYLFIFTYKNE